jgi:hypothetical protein
MLNPDGAELFQRENAAGMDVNRDGRQLSTPEARALKGLRDRLSPDFGFNLQDQNARTRVGARGLQQIEAAARNEALVVDDLAVAARDVDRGPFASLRGVGALDEQERAHAEIAPLLLGLTARADQPAWCEHTQREQQRGFG